MAMARTHDRFGKTPPDPRRAGNPPDPKRRREGHLSLGIQSKLFLSIGALAAFTAISIGVSLIAFRFAQSEVRNFNEIQLPSMVDAGALAIASTEMTIASTKLVNADAEDDRQAAVDELRKAVQDLLEINRSALARDGSETAFQGLSDTTSAFDERLGELDRLTRKRIELAADKNTKLALLFNAHGELTSLLSPRVDKAYYEVITDGTLAVTFADTAIKSVFDDMAVVRQLLSLRSEIKVVVGSASSDILTRDDAWAKVFEDQIVSSLHHIAETTEWLVKNGTEIRYQDDLERLKRTAETIMSLRSGSSGGVSSGSGNWLQRLSAIHKAIDKVIAVQIDDAIFNLTIEGEKAVGKSVSNIKDLLNKQVVTMRKSQESIASLHNTATLLVQGALTDDPSIIPRLQNRTKSMIDNLRTLFATFEDIDTTARMDQIAALADAKTGVMALRSEELQTRSEAELIVGHVFDDIARINTIVEQIIQQRQQAIARSSASIGTRLATNSYALLLLGLIMLAATAAICVLVVHRGLMQPLTRLIGSIRQLAEGDLEVAIEHTGRTDEIGEMSRSLDVFKDNARQVEALGREQDEIRQRAQEERRKMMTELRESIGAVVDAAARGDFSRRVEVTFGEPDLDAMSEAVNKLTYSVELGLNETSSVLSALAQGNLGERVTGNYEGAFLDLRTDVNAMADQISTIAERIALVTAAVRGATNEISSGITDLSTRTEHQASYLEETTASMEELSATVHQNMRNGQEANELAAAARGTAEKGGEVAEKAAAAMQNIEQSSRRITEIVGLIEEIAFQTNLLALNAAVEAARAGEAGRGFSVVASEVRALAQRAGQASKDIRNLILTADGHVREGVELVGDAGSSLAEIVASVKKVSDFIAEIATSGEEQMTGIEQVSNAIVSMDSMTQQNAVLVEETTTSMQSALMQVEDLGQAIAFFRTSGEAGSGEDQEPAEALAG